MVVAEEPPGLISLQLRCPLLLTPAEEGAAVQPVSPFPHRFTPSRLLCRGVEAHALVCFSDAGSTLILPWSPRVGGWEVTPSSLDPRGQSRRGLHGGRELVSPPLGLYTSQTLRLYFPSWLVRAPTALCGRPLPSPSYGLSTLVPEGGIAFLLPGGA